MSETDKALLALRELTEACEAEFCCEGTEDNEPDDSKVAYPEDECHITFGMIRRARAAIAAHESARAQPASVAEPVAWQWRKRENAGDYQGEPYFVWSTWEPLVPPYMDARDLAKTDPDNYEVRPLYTRLQPPSAMAQESGDDH